MVYYVQNPCSLRVQKSANRIRIRQGLTLSERIGPFLSLRRRPRLPFLPTRAMEDKQELNEMLLDGARYGDEDDVTAALQGGADIDAVGYGGSTALHMAAANGHCDILSQLLKAGANVSAANEEGNTALHWACVNHQTEAVDILLEAGASASALNKREETPVDEALRRNFQDTLAVIRARTAPETDVTGSKEVDEFGDEADEKPDAQQQ